MRDVPIKQENLDTYMHIGRRPCEDEGREASGNEGTQKIANKPLEARRETRTRFSLIAPHNRPTLLTP